VSAGLLDYLPFLPPILENEPDYALAGDCGWAMDCPLSCKHLWHEKCYGKPGAHAVYRLYDDAGGLLYIGYSYDVRRRIAAHKKQGMFDHRPTRISVDFYQSAAEARAEERQWLRLAALDECHLYNRQGVPRRNRIFRGFR
jgi:predicted GIY-YIG superfamily endonuclease